MTGTDPLDLGDEAQVAPLLVTRNQLCKVFGVTTMAITKWFQAGMPREGRGRYDLARCVQWRCTQLEESVARSSETVEGKQKLIAAQTTRTELEIAQLRATLIEAATVGQVMQRVAVIVATQLDGLGPRVAGELADARDPALIQQVIFRECRSIRASIADAIRSYADSLDVEGVSGDCAAAA